MYTIIGGDGKEYGPVPTAQIRRWIADGRANLDTRAKAAGSDEWKPLEEFADFGGRAEPPPLSGGVPSLSAGAFFSRRAAAGPATEFSPLDCFGRSWELLKGNFWPLVGATALVCAVQFVIELATGPKADAVTDFAGMLKVYSDYFHSTAFQLQEAANLLLLVPLGAGLQLYFLKRVRQQPATLRDLFAGFSRSYLQLIVASLLIFAFTTIGLICLVLPAIYLAVAYYPFTFLAIVDRRIGAWAGMEASRRAITRHWWSVLLMMIIASILIIAGFLAFGVGILIALPIVLGAFAYAYEDLCGGPIGTDPEPVNSALPTA